MEQNDDRRRWRRAALRRGGAYAVAAGVYFFAVDTVMAAALPELEARSSTHLALHVAATLLFVGASLVYWFRVLAAYKAAEAQSARALRHHWDILDLLPNVVFVLDVDGRAQQWNHVTEQVTGYTAGDLRGRAATQLLAPEGCETFGQTVRGIVAEGTPRSVEADLVRADGRRIPYVWHGGPLRDGGGAVIGIVGIGVDLSELKQAEQRLRASLQGTSEVLEQTVGAIAAAAEARDPYTAGHQQRVAELALAMAREMGLDESRTAGLRIAALLHDIGKLAVPNDILSKPTRLTEAEMEVAKSHVEHGYNILQRIEFPWPVAEIVRQHHERLDGSGYPDGLDGERIVLEARILSVADTVEAMTAHRPYRAAPGLDQARAEVRDGRGLRYDADAADALEAVLAKGFAFETEVA